MLHFVVPILYNNVYIWYYMAFRILVHAAHDLQDYTQFGLLLSHSTLHCMHLSASRSCDSSADLRWGLSKAICRCDGMSMTLLQFDSTVNSCISAVCAMAPRQRKSTIATAAMSCACNLQAAHCHPEQLMHSAPPATLHCLCFHMRLLAAIPLLADHPISSAKVATRI